MVHPDGPSPEMASVARVNDHQPPGHPFGAASMQAGAHRTNPARPPCTISGWKWIEVASPSPLAGSHQRWISVEIFHAAYRFSIGRLGHLFRRVWRRPRRGMRAPGTGRPPKPAWQVWAAIVYVLPSGRPCPRAVLAVPARFTSASRGPQRHRGQAHAYPVASPPALVRRCRLPWCGLPAHHRSARRHPACRRSPQGGRQQAPRSDPKGPTLGGRGLP